MSSMQATFSIATDQREISHHFNIVQIEGLPLKRQELSGSARLPVLFVCNDQHAKRAKRRDTHSACETGELSYEKNGKSRKNGYSEFVRTFDQRSRDH